MDRGNVRNLLAVVIVLVSFQISSAVAGKLQEYRLVEKASVPAGPLNNEIHELQDHSQALKVRLLQKRIFNGPRSDASESQKRFAAEPDTEADIPEHFLQKRWVMSKKRPYGRDAPDDGEKSEPVQMLDQPQKRFYMRKEGDLPEHREVYIPEKLETKFTEYPPQKRLSMSGKQEGRDFPEQQQAFVPGSDFTQERRMYEHPVLPEDGSENSYVTDLQKLLILRDRVKAMHEKLDETIENYRNRNDDTKNGKEADDLQTREWEKFLSGFETN